MGVEIAVAIIGAIAGIIGTVATVASQSSTNQTNKEMTDSTNQTNKEMTDSTNQTNKEIAEETNAINKEIAEQNLQFEQEKFDYDKALQQEIFEREDTSYQRTVNDMLSAGISPLSMSGTDSSGSVVSTKAPQNNFQAQPWQAIASQFQAPNFLAPVFDNSLSNNIMSLVPEILDYKLRKEKQDVEIDKIISETNKTSSDTKYVNKQIESLPVIQEKLKEEVKSLDLNNRQKKRLLDEIDKYDYSSVNLEYGNSTTKGSEIGIKSAIKEAVELNEQVQTSAMKTEQFSQGKNYLNKISAYNSVSPSIHQLAFTEFNNLYSKRNSANSPFTKDQFKFLKDFFSNGKKQTSILNTTDSNYIKNNYTNIKALLQLYESAYKRYNESKSRKARRSTGNAPAGF